VRSPALGHGADESRACRNGAAPLRKPGQKRCQTWIMAGQTLRLTRPSASARAFASRSESSSRTSLDPTWISMGAKPESLHKLAPLRAPLHLLR
jgi:hypothetical protein